MVWTLFIIYTSKAFAVSFLVEPNMMYCDISSPYRICWLSNKGREGVFVVEMKQKVVVIGAGGHAKVIIDILRMNSSYELIGCTDRQIGSFVLSLPVLGDDSILPTLFEQGIHHAFVAIGDNRLRKKLSQKAQMIGFQFVNAISPFTCISDSVKIGTGVAIMPGAVINVETRIGNHSIVNTGASVDHDCQIGDYSHIAPGCNLAGNVNVGNGTFVGIGSKVIDGTSIGEWSMIGGGAAVIDDIPDYCTAVGVPAKIIKSRKEEGHHER